jgi:hypothetical protein
MRPVIALLLRLYPARWRARYGDEFAAVLAERPLGPFDVADVLLGALDAHLHLRGLGAASQHAKGFAMSLRIGGYAAIVGGTLFFAGFLANALDGSDDAWPTSGIILAGTVLLLVGLAGLSAVQARRHPALVWAAFLVPFVGGLLTIAGLAFMGVAGDSDIALGISGWGLGMIGLVTLVAGTGLFALATWRTGTLSRIGTLLLGAAGLLVIPGVIGMLGAWPWEPIVSISLFAMLISFAAGWLITGIAAVRLDRPVYAPAGGTA